MKKVSYLLFLMVFGVLLSGCENSNIFSVTHPKGKNTSPEALLADAQVALIDGNYDDAIEYFTKILDKDPDNSEALYGLAAAELKNAGLDLSELLPKFLNETDISGSPSVFGSSSAGSPSALDDLLPLLNYGNVEAATKIAVEALQVIASGRADGTIPADDIDVNINLAVAKVIHAASYLLSEYPEIEIDEDFNVAGPSISDADKQLIITEIESAIDENLGIILSNTEIDLDDIKSGFETFKAEINQ